MSKWEKRRIMLLFIGWKWVSVYHLSIWEELCLQRCSARKCVEDIPRWKATLYGLASGSSGTGCGWKHLCKMDLPYKVKFFLEQYIISHQPMAEISRCHFAKEPFSSDTGNSLLFQCIHVKVDENRLSAYNSYDPCRVNIHTWLTGGYNARCCFDGRWFWAWEGEIGAGWVRWIIWVLSLRLLYDPFIGS
jgi:hypothetical protein